MTTTLLVNLPSGSFFKIMGSSEIYMTINLMDEGQKQFVSLRDGVVHNYHPKLCKTEATLISKSKVLL